jgi:hypothetical protein
VSQKVISLVFFKGTGPTAKAIQWFSAGPFSHVAALWSPAQYLDSRDDVVGGVLPGVRIRPVEAEPDPHVIFTLPASNGQYAAWQTFLRGQIGKPYDKPGIWGFATGRDWRQPDSWFCSELQAAALEAANLIPALYAPANKITPSALAIILSAINAKPATPV